MRVRPPIISWIIGGFCILLLALVHAELGAMYPLSGGSARFPHYAYGGYAGASFGWFSYIQAVTVAPIEVSATILYITHYHFAHSWLKADGTLTHTGLVVAIVLMAVLASINFLGVRALANTNSAMTWWKVAVPLLTILVVAFNGVHTSNFHAADGFNPYGVKGILLAIPVSGIIFSYLGFEQADQLAGESKNPNRDIPFAVIGSIVIGLVVYIGLQLVFLLALPSSAIGNKWCDGSGDPGCLAPGAAGTEHIYGTFTGPWAQLAALVSLGWLAKVLYFDAVVSPLGTGLIYTAAGSRVSYGLARNNYFHNVFGKLNERKVPAVGVIVTFVVGCVCFLPFPSLAVAGRSDHQCLGADVCRRAVVPRGVPQAAAGCQPSLPAPARRDHLARVVRGGGLDHHVVRLGDQLEARRPDRAGLSGDLQPGHGPRTHEPALCGVAAGVPGRERADHVPLHVQWAHRPVLDPGWQLRTGPGDLGPGRQRSCSRW